MSPTDGENLLTKIGPENLQKEYAFSMCNLNLRQVSINANIVSSENLFNELKVPTTMKKYFSLYHFTGKLL
jgi:hypothetical protein